MNLRFNKVGFHWKTNNGGEWLQVEFPIHPLLRAKDDEFVKAFKQAFEEYIKRTTPEIKKYLKVWRRNDKNVTATPYATHTDPNIQKTLNEECIRDTV